MGNVKITVVKGDDWEALYIDGQKKAEGHSIPDWEFMQALNDAGFEFDYETPWVKTDWLWDNGSPLPEKLWDIPKDAYE